MTTLVQFTQYIEAIAKLREGSWDDKTETYKLSISDSAKKLAETHKAAPHHVSMASAMLYVMWNESLNWADAERLR